MTMIVAIAAGIPCLVLLTWLGMRRIQSLPFARSLALARSGDMRGIALQTIIIMVVLLAIAGTVAGVLLNRAGSETDRLENQEIQRWADIDNPTACEIAGGRPSRTKADADASNYRLFRPAHDPPDPFVAGHCFPPR